MMLVLAANDILSPVSSFQTFCKPSSAFLYKQQTKNVILFLMKYNTKTTTIQHA